jgi:hypothetical protein
MGLGRNLRKEADVCTSSARQLAPTADRRDVARVTIDMLPDVALLRIFDFYMGEEPEGEDIEAWHTLVHVCRNWRNVVFGSPRRLNLQLYCRARTPVREKLEVWPLLPIIIKVYSVDTWDNGNIIAALEHNDRICQLAIFDIPSSETEIALTALQRPFPELTYLLLDFPEAPVVPASFLGGSAPGLQTLCLDRIPFPALPNLLLSAIHLVDLDIRRIPHSGYITPEAMVTALSVLTKLESLQIGFESPRSRPDSDPRTRPFPKRTLLPVLTLLWFKGVSEYLEDLVARIDTPLLDNLTITYYHQLIFDYPQLTQFIRRTPKFKVPDEAHLTFSYYDVMVALPRTVTFDGVLKLRISCSQPDWQLSSVSQVCSSSFPQALIPTVERLYIRSDSHWQDDIENGQWLELCYPFISMKDLYISSGFTPCITPVLKELVRERVTEVFPALQTLFLEKPPPPGPVHETIEQFVAARRLAGHPIIISPWERG